MLLLVGLLPVISQAEEGHSVYYYLMIDRFESGEKKNGELVDVDNPSAFHGGDFQGILNRVDHLNTLGVTDVILSPIFSTQDYTGLEVESYDQIQKNVWNKGKP